jgi:hypothetical protein
MTRFKIKIEKTYNTQYVKIFIFVKVFEHTIKSMLYIIIVHLNEPGC